MKKLLVVLCAIAMMCTMAVTASADTVGTAYTITYDGISLDIDIIDDFSGYAKAEDVYDQALYTFDGEKLTWAIYAQSWAWEGPSNVKSPSLNLAGLEDAYNNATYIGFQVKNVGTADGLIAFEDRNADPSDWATQTWVAEGIKLVSADGIVDIANNDSTSLPNRGKAFLIPAGFDGWIFVPFANMRVYKQENWPGVKANYTAKFEAPHFCGTAFGEDTEAEAILEIDNLFLSSADLTVTENPSDEPSGNPSEEPSEEPSEQPSANPSDDANNDDEQESTADVSVLVYAAAAITGLGALVVAKKR